MNVKGGVKVKTLSAETLLSYKNLKTCFTVNLISDV